MKLKDLSIETLKIMINILLWGGFFVAGFLINNWYTQDMYYDQFQEMLGEALDEENQCIHGSMLDASKILQRYPELENKSDSHLFSDNSSS